MATLLEVRDLRTHFFTQAGVVKAVDGISYELEEGETLSLVGESGCGKSVSALSIMRLVPDPPGKIIGGEVIFDGRDLLKLSDAEIRHVRGKQIAMVYQEPMTSLNPVLTIGRQLDRVAGAAPRHEPAGGAPGERSAARAGRHPGPGAPDEGSIRTSSAAACGSG